MVKLKYTIEVEYLSVLVMIVCKVLCEKSLTKHAVFEKMCHYLYFIYISNCVLKCDAI